MPTYEYVCKECGEPLEVVQSFTDAALTVCPNCGGPLKKVFGNIGIVFKGSGFYKTDSRSGSKSPVKSETSSTETKSDTTPAPAAEKKDAAPKADSKPAATPSPSTSAAAAS